MHFLVSLTLRLGFDVKDFYEAYRRKNQENHARQDGTGKKDGYAVEDQGGGRLDYNPEAVIRAAKKAGATADEASKE